MQLLLPIYHEFVVIPERARAFLRRRRCLLHMVTTQVTFNQRRTGLFITVHLTQYAVRSAPKSFSKVVYSHTVHLMPGTHGAFLDSVLSVRQASFSICRSIDTKDKYICGKTGTYRGFVHFFHTHRSCRVRTSLY